MDLTEQISRGGKIIYELQRMRKMLDVEKSDMRAALEEAEVAGNVCVHRNIHTHTHSTCLNNTKTCTCIDGESSATSCRASK